MRTETPQPIKLSDYRPPAFLVDEVSLTFDLAPHATRVRARMAVRRNGNHSAPLRFNGERLTLVSVAIDGRALGEAEHAYDGEVLTIPAGKRCTFHRHVLDYFWTCHTHGKARGYFEDGSITQSVHFPGDTKHLAYGAGEYMLHSVENIGDTDLLFTTVEFLESANRPLPVPEGVRLKTARTSE